MKLGNETKECSSLHTGKFIRFGVGRGGNVLATVRLVKMLSFLVLTSKGAKRKDAFQKKGARKTKKMCAVQMEKKRENKESRAKTKKVARIQKSAETREKSGKTKGKNEKKTKENLEKVRRKTREK